MSCHCLKIRNSRVVVLLTLIGTVYFTTGCVSQPEVSAMLPGGMVLPHKFAKSVKLHAIGYNAAIARTEISDQMLTEVITQSIQMSGLFSKVVQSGPSDLLLEAKLESISETGSATITGHAVMSWRLSEEGTDKKLFCEMILSEGESATMGDAVPGLKRIRMSTENTIRASVKAGLQRIAQMQDIK